MKVRFTKIEWDTDGEVIPELPIEIEQGFDFNNEEGLEDFLSDWLSDAYGFCHFGFEYEIV